MSEPWDSLKATFPDNSDGFITAETMRDQVDTLEVVDSENVKGQSDQVIIKNPDDVTDISGTILGITDATSTKRYVLTLNAGEYTTAPVVMKPFIYVQGEPGTVVTPSTVSDTMFTMADNSSLDSVTLSGATSGIGATYTGVLFCRMRGVNFENCDTGILLNSTGIINITDPIFGGALTIGVDGRAGEATLNNPEVLGQATLGTFLKFISGAFATVNNAITTSGNVTNALVCEGTSEVLFNSPAVAGASVGLTVSGAGNITIKGGEFYQCNTGIYMPPDANPSILELSGTTTSQCANYDFLYLNENATLTGLGSGDLSNGAVAEGVNAIGLLVDKTGGDEGCQIFGELKVGTPLAPSESCFGEGDSYSNISTTSMYTWDGSVFVDVSDILASPSGSVMPWPNLNVDSALYMTSLISKDGDFLKIPGFKASVTQELLSGDDSPMVVEYWNGAAWVNVTFMASNSSGNYQSYAEDTLSHVGSEQVRFDAYLVDAPWVKNDPMALGTSYYWIRVRTSVALTQVPILEQVKVHSNRTEINEDGFLEFFGKARPFDSLGWDVGLLTATGNNPVGSPTYVSDNLGRVLVGNQFRDGTADNAGFSTYLPNDVDTSVSLRVRFAIFGSVGSATEAQFIVRWGHTTDGESVYPSTALAPATGPNEESEVVNIVMPATANTQTSFVGTIDISQMVPAREVGAGDILWVSVARPIGDAYGGDIAMINLGAEYVKYTLGGHI